MKVAVTGAFGFVGRYIVAELEKHSIAPLLIARPGAARPPHALNRQVVELDIRNAGEDTYELLGRPDTVIHLAWGGLPQHASLHHFADELPAHYRFLEQLVRAGLANLVALGTCFEYGMQSGALSESLRTFPTTPYGYAKDGLRTQLQYLQQIHPFNLTWGRLFYMYGEGQAPSSLWSLLNAAVRKGDATFNLSGGEQVRDYLEVSEAARLIVALALTARDNGVVNICSGQPISVRKLVETWAAQNRWKINLNFGYYPYPNYEPMEFWGDRRKLAACLNDAPEKS